MHNRSHIYVRLSEAFCFVFTGQPGMLACFMICLCLLETGTGFCAVLHVPSVYPTIGEAVTTARSGDTVLVQPGTYRGESNRKINFSGHDIVLLSQNGPETCVIDCEGDGPGIILTSGESLEARIEGFTIRNADTSNYEDPMNRGGAIFCKNASPQIRNCVIRDNTAGMGGGMYIEGAASRPIITDSAIHWNMADMGAGVVLVGCYPEFNACVFSENEAVTTGGAVRIHGAYPQFSRCRFDGNRALLVTGGGVSGQQSHSTFDSCEFTGNTAETYGGAVYDINSDNQYLDCRFTNNYSKTRGAALCSLDAVLKLFRCDFESNQVTGSNGLGGALYCDDVTLTCSDTVFDSNTTAYRGGSMYFRYSTVAIYNCLAINNQATSYGGAVYFYYTNGIMNDCTVCNNQANSGSCVYFVGYSNRLTIQRNIFWGNIGNPIYDDSYNRITVTYSDIQNGYTGTGNINADPLFVTGPAGDYYLSQRSSGQDTDSPCLNLGGDYADAVTFPTEWGWESMASLTTRTDEGRDADLVDMGFHAYPSQYVTPTPTPTATSTPTPTPTQTPSPTPTISPKSELGIELEMPATMFYPGDVFWLRATAWNDTGMLLPGIQIWIILDIGTDSFWFWPGWRHYPPDMDYLKADLYSGETYIDIIDTIIWPDGVGQGDGMVFWAAILDSQGQHIMGDFDSMGFAYAE